VHPAAALPEHRGGLAGVAIATPGAALRRDVAGARYGVLRHSGGVAWGAFHAARVTRDAAPTRGRAAAPAPSRSGRPVGGVLQRRDLARPVLKSSGRRVESCSGRPVGRVPTRQVAGHDRSVRSIAQRRSPRRSVLASSGRRVESCSGRRPPAHPSLAAAGDALTATRSTSSIVASPASPAEAARAQGPPAERARHVAPGTPWHAVERAPGQRGTAPAACRRPRRRGRPARR